MAQKTVTSKRNRQFTSATERGLVKGYRSGLEDAVAAQLRGLGIDPQYETHKIAYTPPVKARTYTPDFILPNWIVVETKGYFDSADRQKHKIIKEQYPDLDIRFVFANPNSYLTSQKDKEFRSWLMKQYGIKVVTQGIKDTYKEEFFGTLKTKPSQTTYADWCVRYGFTYAHELIPTEWVMEPHCEKRKAALEAALK